MIRLFPTSLHARLLVVRVGVPLALLISLTALTLCGGCGSYAPEYPGVFHVYLTFSEDTAHEMLVSFQSLRGAATGEVHYDTASRDGDISAYAHQAEAKALTIPGLPDSRAVYHVRLTSLEPGVPYYFVAGNAESGYSEERMFRTIPSDAESVRFIECGDMTYRKIRTPLLQQAAATEPMFAVLGGDLAHANGRFDRTERWDHWFEGWSSYMVTPKGFTVPILAGIGNHEINDLDGGTPEERAPFFMAFFGHQSGTTYCYRQFGQVAGLFVLDSDHIVPHAGPQAEWIEKELAACNAPAKFAVYHKPMYPAYRDFDGDGARDGRTHWQPLFDRFGVALAFEHHDHVFKRTYPIRANETNPDGIVYVGDGGIGEKQRWVKKPLPWYLARSERRSHFWLVDVTAEQVTAQAVDKNGATFDEVALPLRTESLAAAER